ncbi:sulfatase-like hydrolase/transferase [Algoriphagus machipongonensis]|uniref:Probable sulfatase AtsG n=1 Tax=Algoriphagus machipongonensis TaxID=388413 RepID=A3HRL2_9BACT|nr:sulfatase-like hydrolase/transferase [Algoriphagus machipongonensis]EAZ82480.1 probable sulfatase AtsG [Algoriphagus machipongonensis]
MAFLGTPYIKGQGCIKVLFTCLLVYSASLGFVSAQTKDLKPNIIWLIAEDISPALGAYGDPLAYTPNIDKLASLGVVYTNAWTVAPICAPSRSSLITGIYPTSLGTQHLRSEIEFPSKLNTLPELLKAEGYFVTNRDKTDYNFSAEGIYDYWSSQITPWRNRTSNEPFFSFINIGPSHEGSVNNPENYKRFTQDLDPSLIHDPNDVPLPPYYPDSKETREVWAHYYDILTVLDRNIGEVLDSLKKDGLMEETIIFFIADHGFGMPRYKRWLNKTGMHVPFILSVPEKFQDWAGLDSLIGKKDELVSFIDLAPTVLSLAGAEIPAYFEGSPFLGPQAIGKSQREFAFGARDRADDMVEMSRSVTDGDYIYIRHFMPHLPYIQEGFIFSDVKVAFKALRDLEKAGKTNAEQQKLWEPKPIEELYDLRSDPFETKNLANSPEYDQIKAKLQARLHTWILESRDLGLLAEAEYMTRSSSSTPYEYGKSQDYAVEKILLEAEKVGVATEEELISGLEDQESGVRYWAVMGIRQLESINEETAVLLEKLLRDESASVQIVAAETLSHFGYQEGVVEVLEKWVQDDRPWLALMAARNLLLIGPYARPAIPVMYQVLDKNLSQPGSQRKYKDANFASFTSWALEWALQELGEPIQVN